MKLTFMQFDKSDGNKTHKVEVEVTPNMCVSDQDYNVTMHSWDIPSERKVRQVVCKCGETLLHILYTDDYETSAHCNKCGRMWTVHTG